MVKLMAYIIGATRNWSISGKWYQIIETYTCTITLMYLREINYVQKSCVSIFIFIIAE